MYAWQKKIKVSVPAGGNIDVPLPDGRPVLEKLTIWALSGTRNTTTGLTFQAKLNTINFGGATVHAGPGRLAVIVFQSGDGAADAFLVPTGQDDVDAFNLVMNIASVHGADQEVSLYFAGVGHAGG
jgi:hypothetical protein